MNGLTSLAPLLFVDRTEWRKWLEGNHSQSTGVWIFIRKKDTREQGIAYDEAVEEALCFGWIDGQMRGVDKDKYILRFSPRKPKSIWSKSNTNRAERLVREGKMAPAGIQRVDEAKKNGLWNAAYSSKTHVEVPQDLQVALEQDADAKDHFQKFSNSTKFQYVYWVNQAKSPETRLRRIEEIVWRARHSLRPGEKEIS